MATVKWAIRRSWLHEIFRVFALVAGRMMIWFWVVHRTERQRPDAVQYRTAYTCRVTELLKFM